MEVKKLEAIKQTLRFVFSLQKALENALQDGKFEVSDIIYFKDPLFLAPDTFKLLPELKGGLKDASPEQIEELRLFFVQEFDLKNDKLEDLIEESIKVAISIFALIKKSKKG